MSTICRDCEAIVGHQRRCRMSDNVEQAAKELLRYAVGEWEAGDRP